MLLTLHIENFALIDDLDLHFGTGLNVLTGETGAGKSIILDAIALVLGGKVTSRVLRSGTDRALLEASFRLDPHLQTWLVAAEIDPLDDDVLICSREISTPEGKLRSRMRVNGVIVNKQQMETLRDRLVEMTAQGQAIQLGRASTQRDWLDGFGGAALLNQRRKIATAFANFQQAQQALDHYRHSEQHRLQQLDLLQYQLQDLREAHLSDPQEQTQLEQEAQRLRHSVQLQQQSYQVFEALYEQSQGLACADLLGQAVETLTQMTAYDREVQPILELVEQASAQVQEASRQIQTYGDQLDTDPQRLQEIETRLMDLKQICRKYGPTLVDAIAHQQRIESELALLTGEGQSLEELEEATHIRAEALTQACTLLTQLRQRAAQTLETQLLQELKPLAMDKVQFQVALNAMPPTAYGADQVQFLFSPNPGEPLQPVAETASGGEMGRFLLALKACFSQVDTVGTLIFDEIDAGVSGRVAQAIATKLHQLSQPHQVLCVTHQPIVAAMASHHFRVEKQVLDPSVAVSSLEPDHSSPVKGTLLTERTVVRVVTLDAHQRRQELAQIAGGHSAEGALTFVDTLLAQASALRQAPGTAPEPHPAASSPTRAKAGQKQGRRSRSPR
jgi:DNA repair protein RecN (Recombination protein N)